VKHTKWFCFVLVALACGGSSGAGPASTGSARSATSAQPTAAASASTAPVATPAVPAPPLVVTAMKLTAEKQKGSIELKDDGTITVDDKPVLKIVGADLQDASGKSLILVTADGTLRFEGVAKGAKFNDKDEVVIDDGAKLIVGDDGVVTLINPDGKADKASGKVKLVGFKPAARRAASLFALAAFMMKPSETPAK
jgi:hypothetical protein